MPDEHPRIKREKKTIGTMVQIFCQAHHNPTVGLCQECTEFFEYAIMRLDQCPFHEHKTTCAKCRIHCYTPEMREKVKEIMRYAGPRMIWYHPVLTLYHVIDSLNSPDKAKKKSP